MESFIWIAGFVIFILIIFLTVPTILHYKAKKGARRMNDKGFFTRDELKIIYKQLKDYKKESYVLDGIEIQNEDDWITKNAVMTKIKELWLEDLQ